MDVFPPDRLLKTCLPLGRFGFNEKYLNSKIRKENGFNFVRKKAVGFTH